MSGTASGSGSSTVTILGLSSGPIFGCPDTTYGAGKSFDYTPVNGETKTLADGNGKPIAAAIVDSGEHSVSYSFGIKGDTSTLLATAAGTAITIDGIAAYLKSIKISKKQGDFAEGTIEAVYWNGIAPSSGNSAT